MDELQADTRIQIARSHEQITQALNAMRRDGESTKQFIDVLAIQCSNTMLAIRMINAINDDDSGRVPVPPEVVAVVNDTGIALKMLLDWLRKDQVKNNQMMDDLVAAATNMISTVPASATKPCTLVGMPTAAENRA